MSAQTPTVLWDLDGTVLDPAGAITDGIASALSSRGFTVPENLGRFVGPPVGEALRRFTDVPDDRIAEIVAVYRAGYISEGLARSRVYPGIHQILDGLRSRGVRQAVATQKPEHIAVQVVSRFGLDEYFETVSGAADDLAQPGSDAGRLHDKPAIIGEALRRMGVLPPDPERTVMIGDRRYDADGARSHGIDCLGAGWGFAQPGELQGVCSAVASEPGDLAHLLQQYTNR